VADIYALGGDGLPPFGRTWSWISHAAGARLGRSGAPRSAAPSKKKVEFAHRGIAAIGLRCDTCGSTPHACAARA